MVFDKLKKLIKHGKHDEEELLIKILNHIEEAKINLFNAEHIIRSEVRMNCRPIYNADTIKYHLGDIKGTIERIEKVLSDAEDPEINCKKRCE